MHSIKRSLTFLLVTLLSFFLSSDLYSQEKLTKTQIDSIMKKRWDFRDIKSEYLVNGPEIIKVIKNSCPHEIDSMVAIGTAKMKKQKWGEAKPWFELTLRHDPNNIHANYGYAICVSEFYKYSFLSIIGKLVNWPRSQKHFERVIALDSTYKDVFYQYSLLEKYRENYCKSIRLLHKHISIKKINSDLLISLLRLYDVMIHSKPYDDAESWLKSRSLKYDSYFLGELYRINGLFEKADSIFSALLPDAGELPRQVILLSRVRLCVQNDKPQKAEDFYWQAVNTVTSQLQKYFLLEDFMYIANEKEYEFLKSDQSLNMLPEAMNVFWLRRDPLPSLPYNSRLIEHYRRVIYAEKNFRYDGERHKLYKGDKLNMLKFPKWYYENHKLNDKGLIYIRFGSPDKKVSFIGESSLYTPFKQTVVLPKKISQNMSWLYLPSSDKPKMIFHFVVPEDSPPGYWTLVPGFAMPKESIEQMVDWDHRFHLILNSDNETRSNSIMHELAEQRVETVHRAFHTDRYAWSETTDMLNMFYSIDRYRQSEQKDMVQLDCAIPLSSIFDKDLQRDSVSLETGITIFDGGSTPLLEKIHRFSIKDAADPHVYNNLFIDKFKFPLTFKHYNITIHGRIIGSNKLNGWRFNYVIIDSARNRLACSTLKLAFHISPTTESRIRHRKMLKIIPNPTNKFSRQEALFVYYEIYNLMLNENGNTDYTLNFKLSRAAESKKNVFKRIVGLFGGGKKYQISVENNQTGEFRTETDYLGFDISLLDKGKYKLSLLIKDNVSGQKISTYKNIELY